MTPQSTTGIFLGLQNFMGFEDGLITATEWVALK